MNRKNILTVQYTDVKSRCGPSVGHKSKPPQSQLKQNSRATVPLRLKVIMFLKFSLTLSQQRKINISVAITVCCKMRCGDYISRTRSYKYTLERKK